jgi:hypothetical protein
VPTNLGGNHLKNHLVDACTIFCPRQMKSCVESERRNKTYRNNCVCSACRGAWTSSFSAIVRLQCWAVEWIRSMGESIGREQRGSGATEASVCLPSFQHRSLHPDRHRGDVITAFFHPCVLRLFRRV